ncbi:MAG: type II secretion system F family protein, partial [Candidatus Nitrosocaldus sp.]
MNKIEQEMVSSIGLMAILASTGMRLEEIITYLARGSGQFANDMKWVISKIEVVGMDTITALRMLEERSTGKYKKFITGLIDAYRIGNITEYLINTSNVMMNDKRSKIQKSIENMNLIGEMYIVVMIVFPILAIVMLVILGMLDSNGMIGISTIDMMRLLVYVFIPLIGIIMLIISDSMIG